LLLSTLAPTMSTQNERPNAQPGRENSNHLGEPRPDSLIRRSWHAMTEVLTPFSPGALASLPKPGRPVKYTRADAIPETEQTNDGRQPTVRDYHAINKLPPNVRVPRKVATALKVEGKVWFANERTWVAWLNTAVLLGTLALALFNASKDTVARNFAYVYALISIGVLVSPIDYWSTRIQLPYLSDLRLQPVSTTNNHDPATRSWPFRYVTQIQKV
jgi:hypothetical protein